jgi:beta-lactamase superfamily II metal-dependent hydrolase
MEMSGALKNRANVLMVFASVLLLCVTVFQYAHSRNTNLRIAFLDVGQGDAVLITAPNGNMLLYDSGTSDQKVLTALRNELPLFGGAVDVFVASHPDADHIGGFADVLPKSTPHLYLDGHTVNLSPLFAELEERLTGYAIPRRTVKAGTMIRLGGGVVIDVLAPEQNERKDSLSSNDASVVLLVRYGKSALLLTGDMEIKEEERLVKNFGSSLKATVLKAGHHGSKTASSDALLRAVQPKYVVISAGKNNKYGHPHAAAVSRIVASGGEILETATLGTIHFDCTPQSCAKVQ